MSVRENLKSGKILRQIKAGILSAVMFTGSVMANYAGLIENSTIFAAGEETAEISESSQTLAQIANGWDYEIELKPNGQWKLKLTNSNYDTTIPSDIMSASDFDDYRDNIDEIELPSYIITKIAAHAFEGMKSLHTVSGGNNIEEIGESAFKDCTYLTQFWAVTPNPVGSVHGSLKTIGAEAFSNTGLTEIKMSTVLTEVGDKAFYGCKDLTSISFSGDNNKNVVFGAEAFADCTALKNINLENCTGSIKFEKKDDWTTVFHGCTALETVTIPGTAKEDLYRLFNGATSLKSITFEENSNSISSVGHIASGTSVELLDLTPLKGLKLIGNYWFQEDNSITEIRIPSSVEKIEISAMSKMSSLGAVKFELNDKITEIGEQVFQNDTSLSSINPEALTNLKTINQYAFDGCSALTSITIPKTVTEIQNNAFSGCVGLVNVRYDAENSTVGSGIFDGAGIFDLTIGGNVKKISVDFLRQAQEHISGLNFEGEPMFTVGIDGENTGLNEPFSIGGTYTADKDGNLYKVEESGKAKLVYANKTKGEMTIPESVNGHKVTGIATDAFKNANVTSLTIAEPGNITTLEDYAFANATLLASINGKSDIEEVKGLFEKIGKDSIQSNVFYNTKIGVGIKDETKEEVFPPEGVGTGASPEAHSEQIKIFRNGTMSLNYAAGSTDKEIKDDADRNGKYWTGKVANVNFSYVGGRPVRIYIKADKDAVINFNSSSDPPEETGIDGIYYYDIIYNGSGTGTDALNLSYPNFTSPGSKMQVWAVEFNTEEDFNKYFTEENIDAVIFPGQTLDEDIKDTAIVSDKYFELEWTTQPDNFDLKKEWASNDSVNFIKASDGSTTVSNLKWQIIFTDENPREEDINLGNDIVRYVDYTDEITLPNTLKWREGIDKSLENTRFIKKGNGGTLYVNIDGKDYELFTLSNFANLVSMSVEKGNGNNYLLHWRVINPSTEAEIPAVDNGYITFGSEVIVADGVTAGGNIGDIKNKVHTDEYFTFSDVQKDDADNTVPSFKAPAGKINIKKERLNDITRMGEDVQYKITVENPSAFDYNGMTTIVDNLNADGYKAHYIKPENMQALFDDVESEDKKGDRLTITINNAVLAKKLTSKDANTVAKTGTEISEQDTAADNRVYDDLATDDLSIAHDNVTITLKKVNGNIALNATGGNPTISKEIIISGEKTIADALSEIGYIVTSFDSYQLEWNYENYKLEGGEKLEFTLDTTIKDSLMYLPEKDHDYYYDYPNGITLNLFNSVAMSGDDTLTANTQDSIVQAQQDLEIRKSAFVGDKEIKSDDPDYEKNFSPSDGDIIDYYVKAIHYGTDNYEVLPVVDHMTGMQAVIVKAEWNKDADWATDEKITKTTIDGTEYYILNKAGTYEGVYTSEYFYADSIKVTDVDGGLDTLIKYYIEDTPAEILLCVCRTKLYSVRNLQAMRIPNWITNSVMRRG